MNTEWLKSFSDAVKQKSFSKAAKVNNLSQPALSKHIKNLENNLDIELFHRKPTGIELTEAGERFYRRITPVLSELTAIRQELQQFCRTKTIAIGSLHSLATYYLPSKIKVFQLLDRPLTLMIQNTSDELLQSLQEGKIDAVLVDSIYTGESLFNFELFTENYYAIFPLNHKLKARETVELQELSKEPLIIHESPCDTRNHIFEQIETLGYKPNIVSEVALSDFILGSVSSGMGITIAPELIAKNIGHLDLFALPITNFGRKRNISLLTKNKKLGLQLSRALGSMEENLSNTIIIEKQ